LHLLPDDHASSAVLAARWIFGSCHQYLVGFVHS
jgi:hypothetical protein